VWIWIITTIVLLLAAVAVISAIRAARQQRRQYADAVRSWHETPEDQRLDVLSALRLDAKPNGPAWYLIGCAHLRQYRTKQAARAFGIAHHADCNLETAALLTFACLKAPDGEDSDVVEQIITTWHEMKKPDLLRRKQDQRLMACLQATIDQAPSLSPLGRLAWLVVGPVLRPKVQQLLSSSSPTQSPPQ
jgi:hypothetical protein